MLRGHSATHLDKSFDDQTLWVTPLHGTRALVAKSATHAERALALRRTLGLPTVHRTAGGATTIEGLLANLFFRAHFREAPGAASRPLRKPTVFSGGFADIFGTYHGAPPSDGWGRTVTLCAGDGDDGTVGLKESVVSMKDLVCTSVVRLGRVDREQQPLPYANLVDVQTFLERRHHEELGMDIT